jgi:hypothetical protein
MNLSCLVDQGIAFSSWYSRYKTMEIAAALLAFQDTFAAYKQLAITNERTVQDFEAASRIIKLVKRRTKNAQRHRQLSVTVWR